MRRLHLAEQVLFWGHAFSMAFGLAGLILVLPNPELIASLPDIGQTAFGWSMAGGGVAYMLLGTAAIAVYAYGTLGWRKWLTFMVSAVGISLGSELLGTSTGFPFGEYRYLSGLGYKVAGLVPFTIPLSWFYIGLATYTIARVALENRSLPRWVQHAGAIAVGSLLLTCWDIVLDPAMSQTSVPFWLWEQPGAFFGMPYQNFFGWFGTGVVFMSVATWLWGQRPLKLTRSQLNLPLAVYVCNLIFGAALSAAAGIWIPVLMAVFLAMVPACGLFWLVPARSPVETPISQSRQIPVASCLESVSE